MVDSVLGELARYCYIFPKMFHYLQHIENRGTGGLMQLEQHEQIGTVPFLSG
jgi:hypothetical protein